ncbi:MAG TPA: hypothetical protein VFL93_16660 [Longimicrobiaceae bacterium]|nr:hypothetical protein [Longimicrobiaceae bacterium]
MTAALCLAPALVAAQSGRAPRCHDWRAGSHRNPTDAELRCHFGVSGPGRFGLLSYVDVPVYQPDTPMPGTHVVGVAGMPHPRAGESYETWEWRVLRTSYGPEARRVYRSLELLDPRVAARILKLEARLAEAGIREVRRETWRSPERQAYLFQQGRSRPGPLATATLTSWHSLVDARGRPAGRAVDYDVPASQMVRFHRIVHEVGLESYGADSFDPGHVFLPDPDAIPEREVVLLRVLPRVPEVTLSTGLPVDRSLPAGGRAALRAEALAFASSPFGGGMPRPHLASAVLRIRMVRTPVAPRATARELAERGRGRGGG